jgi:ADP-dependent NAD(P)H-hydrate dehydratase / NAD(P)H-hydrate epimerase
MENHSTMPVPVISVGQMREWEKASWAAGKSEAEVIDQVGRAVARRLDSLTKPGERILFLAGKGHNGDDIRAARKHLSPDRHALLLDVTDPVGGVEEFLEARGDGRCFSWIVDGLFGIGLDRPLDAHWQRLIETVNSAKAPILAMNVPSGLNADSGDPEGGAIRAEITLTVGAPKRGLLKAARFVGRLEVLPEVGLLPCPAESELNWTLATDFAGWPPRRAVESNKGTYGHLAIWAGSFGYHGAAVLASQGALRARPGLVTVYPQEQAYVPVAAQNQAAMVHAWRPGQALPKGCSALLVGPGLAAPEVPDTIKTEMRMHWHKTTLPMVVDASALDWLQPGPTPAGAIRVITPHPGEAGRILDSSAANIQADRVGALRQLSKRLGDCFVVLKGHQTLAGRQSGPIFVNNSGNPYLAQGGSGDLLGGYLAGLLAQPDWQKDALTTIRFAVWQHGAAADQLAASQPNWTVEDLARQLGRATASAL